MAQGKDKGKGKAAKNSKKGKTSVKPQIVAPVIPEKPKLDPCPKECPIYFIYDTCKKDVNEKFKTNMENDGLLYFKDINEVLKMFGEWQTEVEEQKLIDQAKLESVLLEIDEILQQREREEQRQSELRQKEEERRAKLFDIDFTELDKYLEENDC